MRRALLVPLLWGCCALPLHAAVHSVTTFAELSAAVDTLRSGDTIEVAANIVVTSTVLIRNLERITVQSGGGARRSLSGGDRAAVIEFSGSTGAILGIDIVHGKGDEMKPGALSITGNSDVDIRGVDFRDNHVDVATLSAGAIDVHRATARFTDCVFASNVVADGAGGAAIRTDYATVRFMNCDFRDNDAKAGIGGALHIHVESIVHLELTNFTNNKQKQGYSGGAITIEASARGFESVTLVGCEFSGNGGGKSSHDISFVYEWLAPDVFEVLSSCPANFFDASSSGTVSCNNCPSSYPAHWSRSCVPCQHYSPEPGSWTCQSAHCSSIQRVETFCLGANLSGALIAEAADTDCIGAPGPTCTDRDTEVCCAASCLSIDDVSDFCGGDEYGRGLYASASTTSCFGTECNVTVDTSSCCLTTTLTTTITGSTTSRSTTTRTTTITTRTTTLTATGNTTTSTTITTTTSTLTTTKTSTKTTTWTSSTTTLTTRTATTSRTSTTTTTFSTTETYSGVVEFHYGNSGDAKGSQGMSVVSGAALLPVPLLAVVAVAWRGLAL